MSVIVALKQNDIIYMGCDSQVTCGGSRTTLKNPNNYKIWAVNNSSHCLMGSVGNFRDACIIRTKDDLITDYNIYRNHISYDFIVRKIVPDIINELKDAHYINLDKQLDVLDSSFLFAYENQLYSISSDTSVIEVEDYVAIGSGAPEALGSLISTEGLSPEERIIKAIKASAANDIYVDYPIILSNTLDTTFNVITEKNENSFLIKKQSAIKSHSKKEKEE